ncbi:MAG: DNA methyltransferase [Nocardioides sp.]
MPSGEEIQAALRGFVTTWSGYSGTEKSEAQTFLNQLFACYGSDRRAVGAQFEHFSALAGFMDLLWPEVCLVEMKAPPVELRAAQAQVERYWRESADFDAGVRAARFVIVSNFRQFEVWDMAQYPNRPSASFALAELPDRYETLAFLAGPAIEPSFTEHYLEMTQEAARTVAATFHSLVGRSAAPGPVIHSFVMQAVWCMFAEDLGMLDGFPFQTTLNEVRSHSERSAAELGHLFTVLNQKGNHNRVGRLAGTRYVNGDLFRRPADVGLLREEIDLLFKATTQDWRRVDPTIFGSLMEGVLGHDRRWERGAHYTHEVDIMKIVGPTIVRPWRERIEACTTPTQAADLLEELCGFRVLDPACGCGNFLYVAYRELRGLEHELKATIDRLADETGLLVPERPRPFYPLRNLHGIDIEPSSVQLARVTLWMGHRQMIELYGEAEPPLPLQDLSGIVQADALRTPWPETDCIIGNPPFLGDRFIRGSLGDNYVDWLGREFGIGIKDFCVYWFRRAADHLKPGQRAGLVGTNSISQNRARSASLEYVVAQGGVITDAVSSQKWPGDAKVHVSIVNWREESSLEPLTCTLNGMPVDGISPSLTPGLSGWTPARLATNRGHAFYGPVPIGKGFQVTEPRARQLIAEDATTGPPVVRRYLTGADLVDRPDQSPSRWTIDFGLAPLEDARRWPAALKVLRETVKPDRELNNRESYRRRWWQFGEPCKDMRMAIRDMPRFVIGLSTGKRAAFCWAPQGISMNNSTVVFAFDDDYSMGILLSKVHDAWAWAQSSTLETRLRYTPSSVFETFPFPDPVTEEQRERVAEASRRLLARRTEICTTELLGLTKLYNAVDEGAWTDLKQLHRELDEAVVDCYGWPRASEQDATELVRLLTERNREITEGERPYAPF